MQNLRSAEERYSNNSHKKKAHKDEYYEDEYSEDEYYEDKYYEDDYYDDEYYDEDHADGYEDEYEESRDDLDYSESIYYKSLSFRCQEKTPMFCGFPSASASRGIIARIRPPVRFRAAARAIPKRRARR